MTAKIVIRCFIGMLWYGFAGVAVLAAVLLTLARLLLPLAEDYREEAEQTLSKYIGQTVRVASLKAQWAGFEPQLHFSDVRLYDKNNDVILLQFKDARMGIDLFSSIRNRDFVPSSFTISGIEISVTRHADKSFSIDGLSGEQQQLTQDYSNLLLEWLLRQSDIGIESSRITWTDLALNEKNIVFENVNLRLRSDANVHQFDGNVNLPAKLGKKITIAAEFQGTANDMAAWQGEVYVKADDLLIPAWWRKPLSRDLSLKAGHTDFELWGKWQNNSLQDLEGTLSLADLEFSGKHAAAIKFSGLSTALSWHQDDTGMSLQLDDFSPLTKAGAWPASQLSFLTNDITQRLAVAVGYVQLKDVLPLVDVFQIPNNELARQLQKIQPSAILKNLSVVLSTDEAIKQWQVDSRFFDLTMQAWNSVPGVSGLSGSFAISNDKGSLQIDSNKLVIDTAGLFRQPFELEQLSGKIQWQKNESGLLLQVSDIAMSNADISLRARMDLQLPDAGSPVIDLLADIERVDGSQIYKYLPVQELTDATIAWLDKSIIHGMVSAGKIVLRGSLDKFPFDHGEGKFEARFDVVDAKLDYEPGWPAISDIQGEVIFNGRGLDIIGRSGRILDAKIHNVIAHISDLELDNPILELRGKVESSTQDLIEFVTASNLAEGYKEELRQLETHGDVSLQLNIHLPMSSGDGVVNGEAEFKNVKLSIKGNNIQLQDINGKLLISNDGLQGKDINGRLFEIPLKIQLSHGDDALTVLSIKMQGEFNLNKLLKEQLGRTVPIVSTGKTEWLANLSFRHVTGDEPPFVFELESELKGVTINLPAPFAKQTNAIKSFKLITYIHDDSGMQMDLSFGDDIDMIVLLKNNGTKFEYAGASVAFGDALPLPPENNRLSITGQLDALSLDEWVAYANTVRNASTPQSNDLLAWLEEVNIKVAVFSAMGSNFNLKHLKLEREDDDWYVVVDADKVKGEIRIPYSVPSGMIKANFELLKLERIEDETVEFNFDPRKLPSVALSVDQFIFDGVKLGSLNMTTSKTDSGLVMDQLVIDSPDTTLTASGSWQVEDDKQITRLKAKLKTQRFSDLLTELGYLTGFEAGKSRNKAHLEWPGSPLQFSVGNLNGSIKIKIDRGQLLDISPGAGRIFGLLSLQTLPRRLTLDFSDLFKKGFSFDRIKGHFRLEQGDAYTTDLYLEGPAARIDISGRAGLVARDYDQLITVTPNLTSSLPLAGALLGGPIAGGVILALDKLLRPAIDDITRYQYTVTGSWDDPQVEQLEEAVLDITAAE